MTILTVHTPRCIVCEQPGAVEVDFDGFAAWKAGQNLQEALPQLDADQRELLLTGTHAQCFEKLFAFDKVEEA